MKSVLKVLYNCIRGVFKLALCLIVVTIFRLIKIFTYEPGTNGMITPRKARRIRALSRFKLFIFNTVPEPVLAFFDKLQYKEYINTHLKNGLQLRYVKTNQ